MGWPGPVTGRQFAAWCAWLDEDWNNPDRTDHYLMQLCMELVVSRLGKDTPSGLSLDRFKIPFKPVAAKPGGTTSQEASMDGASMKAALMGALGGGKKLKELRERDRDRNGGRA